jgi:hypothetical protein
LFKTIYHAAVKSHPFFPAIPLFTHDVSPVNLSHRRLRQITAKAELCFSASPLKDQSTAAPRRAPKEKSRGRTRYFNARLNIAGKSPSAFILTVTSIAPDNLRLLTSRVLLDARQSPFARAQRQRQRQGRRGHANTLIINRALFRAPG